MDLDEVLRDFTFYWQSQEGAKALKASWGQAWSNWLINEAKWGSSKTSSRGQRSAQMNQLINEIVNREEEDQDDSLPF